MWCSTKLFKSNNFDNVKRIELAEQKPVTWPTNVGIIRNITKKGTSDGGKSGLQLMEYPV
jgi:hypothetical protein